MQDHAEQHAIEVRTIRKVTWRIMPACFILYIISYLDRANIGYAALQMNKELALSSEAFGFASGVFFLSYFLFEVPSNALLAKFGARVWIARILVSWGIVAALTAFAQNETQLYILRFLLGVAEAGFFPGIIVYLSFWFRAKERATTVSVFLAAIPVSYLIGAPISTFVMDAFNNVGGWSGWRWMLFLEGVPALIGGIAAYFLLTERPEDATWLQPEEKSWLAAELARDRAARPQVRHLSVLRTLVEPKIMMMSFICFVYMTGSLGVGYWMPQIIHGFSGELTNTQIGLVAMVPYAVATVGMVWWSHHSDKTGERKMHSAWPLLLAGVTLLGVGFTSSPVLALVLVSLSLAGLYAFKAPFWAVPSLFLSLEATSTSIAAINSVGNLGGFVGPWLIGVIKDSTGSAMGGLIFLSIMLFAAFLMTALLPLKTSREPGHEPAPAESEVLRPRVGTAP